MEKYKLIIADDDHPSRLILSHFIQLFPQYEIVCEAADGEELIQRFTKKIPDIVLVDVDMPKINGMEAMKICKEIHPSLQVIFTTGYDEFAVEAFNLSATDYIVKPIERTRLFTALEKAKKAIEIEKKLLNKHPFKEIKKLSIKSNQTFHYISSDDILFIEKNGRKTVFHTAEHQHETNESLQEIEGKLPCNFYKTHRSYIVNLKKIIKIEPQGETYAAHFSGSDKVAYISKLKIQEVHGLLRA
ncbi:LytTR family DNA-binding domain-containing protein [Aeribacillus composti]|uniref:LytR/AlgR family response regulator transcription factor n=1 Tax=Aeribacillus composti TaxID=1868734 RepID=UPI002E22AA8C|nr:LytTR family DNA-binding domain-containing protein [Aeribacillus composti]